MLQVVVYNVKLIGCLSSAANIDLSIVWGSGISPMVYVFMKRDLQTLSQQNIVFKYADDTTVLVPQHTDIDVRDEFYNVKQWACNNKLVLNRNKTKERFSKGQGPCIFICHRLLITLNGLSPWCTVSDKT